MMDGIAGGVMGLMMLLWMLIVAGALIGVIGGPRLMKRLRDRESTPPALPDGPHVEPDARQPTALEEAKERYVRGEIDHAELDRLLETILTTDQRATKDV